MIDLYNIAHYEIDMSWDLLISAGLNLPTEPLDENAPTTIIIGTIVIGILVIIIYRWVMPPTLIQVQNQQEEPPIFVQLVAMYVRCSDGLYRKIVIDYYDPEGTILAELWRGLNVREFGINAVYGGTVSLFKFDQSVTSHSCYFTNETLTADEANAQREEMELRIAQRPDSEFAYLEFPVHVNITRHNNREVRILTGGQPVRLAFSFEGVPSNFHSPIYNGRRIPNLIESRNLILTCSAGFLRPNVMADQHMLISRL